MKTYKRKPPKPEHTQHRRETLAKARAAQAIKRAQRREKMQELRDSGLSKKAAREQLARYPLAPDGKHWNLDDVITAVLEDEDAVESRYIVDAMVKKARAGNVQAAEFLAERSLGKPIQKVQMSGGLTLESLDQHLPNIPNASVGEVADGDGDL